MITCCFHSHNKYDSNVEDSGLNSGDGNILCVFGVCNDKFLGQVAQRVKQEHDCESLAGAYMGGGARGAAAVGSTGQGQQSEQKMNTLNK
jgi:hypothetical protein